MDTHVLKQLLTKSHEGDYTNIIAVIVDFLKKNTKAEIILQKVAENKSNIIARFGQPKLLINAHMDTVPPSGDWHTDPYSLTPKDQYLYGLGTADTKGSLFAALTAAAATQPENLMLLFSIDEEVGDIETTGVSHFFKENIHKNVSHAIVLEPTNCQIVTRHKGYFSYFLHTGSRPEHSSEVSLDTDNAIVKASTFIPGLHQAGFNVGRIQGGTRGNTVPDTCMVHISTRSFDTAEAQEAQLKKICGNQAEIEPRCLLPPFENRDFDGETVAFWTEAPLFQNMGISTIVYGAGSIKQAHGANEYVPLSHLEEAIQFFSRKIEEFQ